MAKLNLGCGPEWEKNYSDYEGLDIVGFGQKHIGDVMLIKHFGSSDYDEVMANHFLEHFSQDELRDIFKEVYRILKPGGIFRFAVPHRKHDRAYVLSHKTFWDENTVKWLERDDADKVYGFGRWKIKWMHTNKRPDIHVELVAVK